MNSKPLPPFVPIGIATVLVGFLCFYGGGCSDSPDSPGATDAANDRGTPPQRDATQRVVEELFGAPEAEVVAVPAGPELAFLPQTEGLPTGGTWREYPLLHDFTGDGRADLIAANREEDGLNAWRAPAAGETAWALRIDGLPRDLMYGGSDAADLDGDGDQDLVFVAHKTGLRVFLNDGEMGWTAGADFPNPFLMLDVALGDLDGDGHADAVGIAHFTGGIGVYMGDGKGGFGRLDQSKDVIPTGRFGVEVQLADVDTDGMLDILACTDKGAVLFYTRKSDDGDLSWVDGSQGLPAPVLGNSLRGLVPADFTGDGELDLAFCALADPGVPENERVNAGVLARNEDGSWTAIDTGLPRGAAFNDIAAGDFDQDGHMDIVLVTSKSGAAIHRGDGSGGFTLAGHLPGSKRASWVAVGDADGDSRLDVAIQSSDSKRDPSGGGIVVYLNRAEAWSNE